MSVEIVLVSAERPDLAVLRERFADPGVVAVLGTAAIGGDPTRFPHVTRIDTPRLSVDLYGPHESHNVGGVAPYSTDLGVAAPTDVEGRSWWTEVDVVSGLDDDPAVEALLGVLATLAAAGGGHVVVQGELVELPGVPPPAPSLTSVPGHAATDLAGGRTFLGLFLPFTAPDQAGWERTLGVVHALTEDVPDLWPRSIMVDGEWRDFEASPQPPSWWPMEQQLATAEPETLWDLAPAGFPGDVLTSMLLSAAADPTTTERLLPAVLRAEPSYAFLHHSVPGEPLPDSGVGLRQDDPHSPPWTMLTARDLAVALPGPSWVQVLGPEWEEALGRERLASAPAHRVEEVGPHRWLVQLTASAADLEGIVAERAAVRAHLGADVFWSRGTTDTPRVAFAVGDRT